MEDYPDNKVGMQNQYDVRIVISPPAPVREEWLKALNMAIWDGILQKSSIEWPSENIHKRCS